MVQDGSLKGIESAIMHPRPGVNHIVQRRCAEGELVLCFPGFPDAAQIPGSLFPFARPDLGRGQYMVFLVRKQRP